MDFSIFYKNKLKLSEISGLPMFDLFISTYNRSERVTSLFNNIPAKKKVWLINPQYQFKDAELPSDEYFLDSSNQEDDFIINFDNKYDLKNYKNIGIDITGFIRPHLIFFINYLYTKHKRYTLTAFYSEPNNYLHRDNTQFTDFDESVKTIPGCGTQSGNAKADKDILIIASGYEDKLITRVSREKKYSFKKFQIICFPSIQPDMYHENRLRVHAAQDELGEIQNFFAPAYDPFITANVISEIISKNEDYTNLYLSPLSTKAHTLGFILYYIWEAKNKPISIIFPYCNKYENKPSDGIGDVWKYELEFPKY